MGSLERWQKVNIRTNVRTYAHTYARHRPYIPSTTLLCEGITKLSINMSSDADVVYWRWKRNKNGLWLTVCFVPSVYLSIRKSCQRHDWSELGIVRNWVEHHCNWQLPLLNQRKEKRKYVARPGIEPRTPDLRVRCPTDCAKRPGPRNSVDRLTDRPDMTIAVYRGRKTTKLTTSIKLPSCVS